MPNRFVSRLASCIVLSTSPSLHAEPGDTMKTLFNPSPEAFSRFGHAVAALTFEELLVSAPGATHDSRREGVVYVLNTWSGDVRLRLHRPEPQDVDLFGVSTAVDGARIIVGDPRLGVRTDRDLAHVGAVHVFASTDGTLVDTISNPDPRDGDLFGWVVKAWRGEILITALGEARNQGLVYLFDLATRKLVKTFADPATTGDGFGRALDTDGKNILIGAPRYDAGEGAIINSGIVYVYDSPSGGLVSTLRNPAPAENDGFGAAVAIAIEGVALVGTEAGKKAYGFDLRSGELRRTFTAPQEARGSYGYLVSASGRQVFVAANLGWIDVFASPLGARGASFVAPETSTLPTDFTYSISMFTQVERIVVGNGGVRHDFEAGGFAKDSGAAYILLGLDLGPAERFLRGDSNDDGRVNIADSIWLISYLFRAGPRPSCGDAADPNDDGQIDIADAMFIINYQLFAGPSPPEPFVQCGEDPTRDDHLVCDSYSYCFVEL